MAWHRSWCVFKLSVYDAVARLRERESDKEREKEKKNYYQFSETEEKPSSNRHRNTNWQILPRSTQMPTRFYIQNE